MRKRKMYLSVEDIAELFGLSVSFAYRVEDNGVGMSEEQCRSILHKEPGDNSGIGIKNVNDRIKIYFGKEYGLSIESELDEGTTVIIRMPKVEENAAAGWEKV